MTDEIERRNFEVELRGQSEGEAPRIDGTAAVYNRLSEDLGGFREIIEPGFFENVMKDDVRALFNHDDNLVLGRTRAGTLSLEDTERGLDVHITPPDTTAGRDAITLIKRRDVTQMSFAFTVKPDGQEWIREKDGSIKRVLKRGGAARLYDVSPVTYPAYPQTSVNVRSKIAELTEGRQFPAPEGDEARAKLRAKHNHRKRQLELKQKGISQ